MAKSVNYKILERGQGFHLFTEPTINPERSKSEVEAIVSNEIGYDVTLYSVNVHGSTFGSNRVYVLQRSTDYQRDQEIRRKKRANKSN